MRQGLALAIVGAMLAVPAAGASPWTQAGYDAARTGDMPEAGPAWNDTAFVAQLPGEPYYIGDFPSRPLIAEGHVYMPVGADSDGNASGVARVALESAEVEMFVETDRDPQAIAISDGTLVIPRTGGMDAYALDTGERVWRAEHPAFAPAPAVTLCGAPAVHQGAIVAPCTEVDTSVAVTGLISDNAPGAWYPFVWAVDAHTGETMWAQGLNRTDAQDPSATSRAPEDARPGGDGIRLALGVSVVGDRVLSVTIDQFFEGAGCVPGTEVCPSSSHQRTRFTLWGLDAGGGLAWWNSTEVLKTRVQGDPRGPFSQALPATSFEPTGGSGVAFTKFDGKVQKLNPTQGGEVLWEDPLGQEDARAGLSGAGSALTDEALYVSSLQSISKYSLGPPAPSIDWQLRLESPLAVSGGTLVAAGESLYLLGYVGSTTSATVMAVNTTSGALTWTEEVHLASGEKQEYPAFPFTYAVGEGVLVAVGEDGTVHVIGETAASLGEPALDTERYPDAGEAVSIDASTTDPGAFGPADRYMVDWGDGTVTGWQHEPVFTHVYEDERTYEARILAGNDANQTASTFVTMNVGQEAPTEPNAIERAFQKNNQDMTFGILGLLVAVTGGAVGVARRYRERSRLQEELEALEEGFEDSRGTPGECEAFLETRKARARSLVVDGVLTEEQFGVIESRIEELRGQLRISMLDERFAFLPHGMVKTLERMLEDGHINAWEHETLMDALEEQEMLTEAQKGKVERLIGQWSGGGEGA